MEEFEARKARGEIEHEDWGDDEDEDAPAQSIGGLVTLSAMDGILTSTPSVL